MDSDSMTDSDPTTHSDSDSDSENVLAVWIWRVDRSGVRVGKIEGGESKNQ